MSRASSSNPWGNNTHARPEPGPATSVRSSSVTLALRPPDGAPPTGPAAGPGWQPPAGPAPAQRTLVRPAMTYLWASFGAALLAIVLVMIPSGFPSLRDGMDARRIQWVSGPRRSSCTRTLAASSRRSTFGIRACPGCIAGRSSSVWWRWCSPPCESLSWWGGWDDRHRSDHPTRSTVHLHSSWQVDAAAGLSRSCDRRDWSRDHPARLGGAGGVRELRATALGLRVLPGWRGDGQHCAPDRSIRVP